MSSNAPSVFAHDDLSAGELRLLFILPNSTPQNINCRLIHINPRARNELLETFDDHLSRRLTWNHTHRCYQYAALSYCWGCPTAVAHITINGQSLPIAQNLLQFFEALTSGTGFDQHPWWIDAVCINQDDAVEKTQQVQRMWWIYAHAERLYSWLGPSTDQTELAFRHLRNLYQTSVKGAAIEFDNSPSDNYSWLGYEDARSHMLSWNQEVSDAILSISTLDYWERTWIWQEVINARWVTLMCGSDTTPLASLWLVRKVMAQPISEKVFDSVVPLPAHTNHPDDEGTNATYEFKTLHRPPLQYSLNLRPLALRLVDARFHQRWTAAVWEDSRSFIDCLKSVKDLKCTDPRDHIFATLGFPQIQRYQEVYGELSPDYTMCLEELFIATIAYYETIKHRARRGTPSSLSDEYSPETLDDVMYISSLIGIDISSHSFLTWLRKNVRSDTAAGTDFLPLECHYDKSLDCSSIHIQDLLHNGPIARSRRKEYSTDQAYWQSISQDALRDRTWLAELCETAQARLDLEQDDDTPVAASRGVESVSKEGSSTGARLLRRFENLLR